MSEWIMVGVGLVLTVGTGLFVASEFALVNLDRADLENRRDRGEKRLTPTINALRITSTHLSGAQLGITLTTLLTGYTFEPAVSSLLLDPLTRLGLPTASIRPIGAVIGIALATLFSMVVGELAPKNFALALPLATAKLVIPFQTAFTTIFKPVILLLNNSANVIVRAFGIEPKEELSGARSAEELSSLVRRSAIEGTLDRDQADLLHRTVIFSARSVSDVLTPRVSMRTVAATDTAESILNLARETGYSKFPVIGEDIDDIVGIVHVKHAFAIDPAVQRQTTARELMVPPLQVPITMGVDRLLELLREHGLQTALVIDEYGGTAGLVTLEDLVEELIGDLQDEHDRRRVIVARSGDDVHFDASLRPDELLDRTGIKVPTDEDYETVAGFILDRLGRVPDVGDEVRLDDAVLRVAQLDGRRITRISYHPDPETIDGTTDRPKDVR